MALWPYTFLVLPILNFIARAGIDETTGALGSTTIAFLWIGIVLVLLLSKIAGLSYSCVFTCRLAHEWLTHLFQSQHDSHQRERAKCRVARAVQWHSPIRHVFRAVVRSLFGQVSPILSFRVGRALSHGLPSSSMYALSTDYNLMGGYLWAVIMATVSFLGATISRKIEQHSVKTIA